MDERVQRHAELIVDHSTDVGAGDDVLLNVPTGAEGLGEAIATELGKRGAPYVTVQGLHESDLQRNAWLRAATPENIRLADNELALVEETDVAIAIRAGRTVSERQEVSEEMIRQWRRARQPLQNEVLSNVTWCATQYPSAGYAQRAGMSIREYEEFVYGATLRDWDAVREHQAQLVDIIEDGSEVRIQAGETTDIHAYIDGMHAVNDFGEKNLPGGEVFTAPVVDSVDGEVLFDVPVQTQGRELENVRMTVEDGEIIDHSAEAGEELLASLLEAEGGSRFGELGFGMNRQIDRPTRNMLLDEKLGDTVHMAFGRAYGETVGEHRERNESGIHEDLIVDMSEDATIEVDGEVIYEDGWYVFEEGFEGE